MRVTNPGEPITVEVKTAIHFPGGAVATLLGLFVLDQFDTGEVYMPIIGVIVPGDAPKGAYTLEAALWLRLLARRWPGPVGRRRRK